MRPALEALRLTRVEIPPAATPARIRLGLQSLETIRALTSYPRTQKIAWTWIGSPFLALLLAVGDIQGVLDARSMLSFFRTFEEFSVNGYYKTSLVSI
jgi:hypothetical protein